MQGELIDFELILTLIQKAPQLPICDISSRCEAKKVLIRVQVQVCVHFL